ncbi:Retrovirus-related Pol polyprotein, partial [Mucuna pruriens]
MCDASNSALEAIIGQCVGKQLHVIAYASRTIDLAQVNYTTTKKELLAIVFALEKFRSYLLGSKVIVFSGHATLKYLLKKLDVKSIQAIKEKLESDAKYYIWDDPYLWKLCSDQVEAKATKANDAKTIVEFVKSNIFYRFGVPKEFISDQGSHFCNRAMATLLEKHGVAHRVAYRTSLGMSPYRIVFGKACHLPVEIEHRAYWVIKECNMAYDQAG